MSETEPRFLVGLDDVLGGPNIYFAICQGCQWRVSGRDEEVVNEESLLHRCANGECLAHGPYRRAHGRCPHRHCGDDRPDADHETCTPGSYDGDMQVVAVGRIVDVDPCIADIVEALNRGGVPTSNSCCGHGKAPGGIALSDGRWLVVCYDHETAMKLQRAEEP